MADTKLKTYSIIRVFLNGNWSGKWIVQEGDPMSKVVDLLGGTPTRTEGELSTDGSAAFWNESNGRRAYVMAMPAGLPLDAVYRVAEARS